MSARLRFPLIREPRSAARRPLRSGDLLLVGLILTGLAAAWLAEVLPVEQGVTGLDAAGKFILIPVKSAVYYAAHAMSIGALLTAGVIGGLSKRFRNITPESRIAFAVLLVTAVTWSLVTYRAEELLSSALVGATGPFVWIMPVVVFAGANRRIWPHLDRFLRMLAYLTAALALRLLASPYVYYRGFSKYILYAMLLFWLGGWTLLTATGLKGFRLLPRLLPYVMMLAMSLCSQSRSWTLLGLLLGATFIYLRGRERGSLILAVRSAALLGAGGAVIALGVAIVLPQTLHNSIDGFRNRLKEDTRSGQYTAFFESVPPSDLLLGRGPKGTWYWRGWGDYQFFDNGFLWTLFIGGIPTLLGYGTLMFWPAFKALRAKPHGADAAALAMVLLETVSMTGLSTFTLPTVGLVSYLWAFYAGRCYLVLAESSRIKRFRNRYQSRHSPGQSRNFYSIRRIDRTSAAIPASVQFTAGGKPDQEKSL
jgi:hypothetical protein